MSIRVTSVNGGAVDGITTTGATLVATHINGTVTTYTYIVPEGGTTVSFRGNVTGTITAVVTYAGSFGTISSSAISITGA